MINIVVGGQMDKQEIANLILENGNNKIRVDIKSDLEAAMALSNLEFDYYIGACNTGGGGAIAMAIALIGFENCVTLSTPGNVMSNEEIYNEVMNSKKAFGIVAQDKNKIIPILITYILKRSENL